MAKEALECTISLEVIQKSDELYLTNGEMSCLYNMAVYAGSNELNPYWEILQKICDRYEEKEMTEECVGQYEWFMTAIASTLGNAGMHDQSDACAEKVIRLDAHCYRIGIVAKNMECISWNNMQRQKKGIPVHGKYNRMEELECHIAFWHFCKKTFYENLYRKKWEALKEAAIPQ